MRSSTRRGFFSADVAIVTLIVICLVILVLAGVSRWKHEVEAAEAARLAAYDEVQRQASEQTIETRERVSRCAITFTHDNHWWVSRLNADYLVHHPDCPCRKPAERE